MAYSMYMLDKTIEPNLSIMDKLVRICELNNTYTQALMGWCVPYRVHSPVVLYDYTLCEPPARHATCARVHDLIPPPTPPTYGWWSRCPTSITTTPSARHASLCATIHPMMDAPPPTPHARIRPRVACRVPYMPRALCADRSNYATTRPTPPIADAPPPHALS